MYICMNIPQFWLKVNEIRLPNFEVKWSSRGQGVFEVTGVSSAGGRDWLSLHSGLGSPQRLARGRHIARAQPRHATCDGNAETRIQTLGTGWPDQTFLISHTTSFMIRKLNSKASTLNSPCCNIDKKSKQKLDFFSLFYNLPLMMWWVLGVRRLRSTNSTEATSLALSMLLVSVTH